MLECLRQAGVEGGSKLIARVSWILESLAGGLCPCLAFPIVAPNGWAVWAQSTMSVADQRGRLPAKADGYELREQIGRGTNGVVYRAWCESIDDEVAIRIIDVDQVQASLDDIYRDIRVMSLSSHRNVLPFSTCFVTGNDLWVVMPLLTGGSVSSLISCQYTTGLPPATAIYVLHSVLAALDYFHANGQIHRDVRAANIMLDATGQVLLSDYGMMGWMVEGPSERKLRQTFVGTPCWMAPEVMEQTRGYDYKADIWSLGITALELATGTAPYLNYSPMKVLIMTLQNPPPELTGEAATVYPEAYKDFLSQCLQKDPEARASARKLLNHPVFDGVAKPADLESVIASLPPIGSRGGSQKQLYRQLQKAAEPSRSGIWNLSVTGLGWDFGDDTVDTDKSYSDHDTGDSALRPLDLTRERDSQLDGADLGHPHAVLSVPHAIDPSKRPAGVISDGVHADGRGSRSGTFAHLLLDRHSRSSTPGPTLPAPSPTFQGPDITGLPSSSNEPTARVTLPPSLAPSEGEQGTLHGALQSTSQSAASASFASTSGAPGSAVSITPKGPLVPKSRFMVSDVDSTEDISSKVASFVDEEPDMDSPDPGTGSDAPLSKSSSFTANPLNGVSDHTDSGSVSSAAGNPQALGLRPASTQSVPVSVSPPDAPGPQPSIPEPLMPPTLGPAGPLSALGHAAVLTPAPAPVAHSAGGVVVQSLPIAADDGSRGASAAGQHAGRPPLAASAAASSETGLSQAGTAAAVPSQGIVHQVTVVSAPTGGVPNAAASLRPHLAAVPGPGPGPGPSPVTTAAGQVVQTSSPGSTTQSLKGPSAPSHLAATHGAPSSAHSSQTLATGVGQGLPSASPPTSAPQSKKKSRFEVVSVDEPRGATQPSSSGGAQALAAAGPGPAQPHGAVSSKPRSRFEVKDVERGTENGTESLSRSPRLPVLSGTGQTLSGTRSRENVQAPQARFSQPSTAMTEQSLSASQTASRMSMAQCISHLVQENEALRRELAAMRGGGTEMSLHHVVAELQRQISVQEARHATQLNQLEEQLGKLRLQLERESTPEHPARNTEPLVKRPGIVKLSFDGHRTRAHEQMQAQVQATHGLQAAAEVLTYSQSKPSAGTARVSTSQPVLPSARPRPNVRSGVQVSPQDSPDGALPVVAEPGLASGGVMMPPASNSADGALEKQTVAMAQQRAMPHVMVADLGAVRAAVEVPRSGSPMNHVPSDPAQRGLPAAAVVAAPSVLVPESADGVGGRAYNPSDAHHLSKLPEPQVRRIDVQTGAAPTERPTTEPPPASEPDGATSGHVSS